MSMVEKTRVWCIFYTTEDWTENGCPNGCVEKTVAVQPVEILTGTFREAHERVRTLKESHVDQVKADGPFGCPPYKDYDCRPFQS